MSETQEKQKREEVFTCRNCGNRTSHLLLKFHAVDVPLGFFDANLREVTAPDYYFLFECKTCKGISLKHVFSEQLDPEPGGKIPFDNIDYLYPSARTFNEEVPSGLRLVMKEANKVKFTSSMAYLILVRKVLEELCRDKKITGADLRTQLAKLVEQENLPSVFANASNKLRLLGNIGAHASDLKIDEEEIRLVEEFIYALIEYIYVIPSKLEKLNNAYEKQSKK